MELTDGSRVCTDCGHYFRVSDGEKRQLERLGYQLPVRCLACRRLRKELAAREADCRQADCRQADCRQADCRQADCRQAEQQ